MIGYLFFSVIFGLLWAFSIAPWWMPAWFLGVALTTFLRLIERKQEEAELPAMEAEVPSSQFHTLKRLPPHRI
ncbi:hypothetical protein [Streptomyces sp. NPDC004376]